MRFCLSFLPNLERGHWSGEIVRFALAGLIVFAFSNFVAPVAQAATVNLCNETSYFLQVSLAYADGAASRSEGWIAIEPGRCVDAFETRPDNAQAYVYAVSDHAHAGTGLLFDGRERFCIDELGKDFEIDGRRECRLRGFTGVDFAAIDLRSKKPRVTFSEPQDYKRQRAVTAAVQRLLQDLGYDISLVDGFVGRQTEESIREYVAAHNVPQKISNSSNRSDLMLHMFQTVKAAAASRGLRFCNETSYLVWAAAGTVTAQGVMSKGWVRIPAGSCRQAMNEQLKERYYFTYAEAVGPDGEQVYEAGRPKIWSGEFPLCVKSTRFVIEGNEDCAERGFNVARFRRVDTGAATTWTVTLE
jgi:uncharacterized membrane protein